MDALTRIGWIGFIALVVVVSGCGGGGGGGDGGTPPAGTVVGAAGGTVVGPNGAQVVIPAGALATNTTINIAQIASSTAALPAGFSVSGQMFAFTPHGTTFAVPVTMTLPFNPALVPAGTTPQFFKTNAQFQWEPIATATFGADTASAQVTSFSDAVVVIPPLFRGDPVREWTFSDFRGRNMIKTELVSLRQEGGVFEEFQIFGPVFPASPLLDHEIFSIDSNGVIGQDGQANGQVFSSADGVTYGVFAEAPFGIQNVATSPAGGAALLRQFQAFIKRSPDATLSFTLVGAFIDLRDDNEGFSNNSGNPKCVYPPDQVDAVDACQDIVRGQVILLVKAYTHATSATTAGRTFFHTGGTATLLGHKGNYSAEARSSMLSSTPLWILGDFDFDVDDGLKFAIMNFRGPRTYTVDLSSLEVGDEFTLSSVALAEATNRAGNKNTGQREFPSAAAAFLRDPLSIGGTTLAFSGLEPINNPVLVAPPDLIEPAPCVPGPAPDPAAGVIQFSAANYTIEELGSAVQPVTVTRTGGSRGAITATFATSDGTAIAGTNYTPVNVTVFFGDGDTEPRAAEIPIIESLASGDPSRSVNLTLSQPGGCAALGSQATAVLTIEDQDLPAPPPSFTIGGTVTGLVGSGLVLQDLTFRPITPGNGAFTFAVPTRSGFGYAVSIVTQPTNPIQICTVTNGSGTVADANITNVAVDCATPTVNGSLDASFGSAGKVTTPLTGIGTALALQADGKIVTVGGAFTLTRHDNRGVIDTSFGGTGKVTTAFFSGSGSVNDVALQTDSKIVAVGSTRARAGFSSDDDFALRRYKADGSLDESFGAGGIVATDFFARGDQIEAVAIHDGKIIVVGQAQSATGVELALARYDANGVLDPSFGRGGKLTTDVAGGLDFAAAIVVQPDDGKIVVLARVSLADSNTISTPTLLRYDSSGALDSSFGVNGKAIGSGNAPLDAMALQADGKIIVAGSLNAGTSNSAFALNRFLANGSADTPFGTPSLAFFSGGTGNGSIARSVAIQADGRIVLVGEAASGASTTFDWAIARFNSNGGLDTSFGNGGKLLIDFFAGFDGANDVLIQPNGAILAAGSARNGSATEFALARINP